MREESGLKQMKVDVPELKNLDWLSDEEYTIVKDTLDFANVLDVLEGPILTENALNMHGYYEDGETSGVTVQNILFNNDTRIEISSVPNDISLFGVKVFHIEQANEKTYLRIVSNFGGEIIADTKEDFTGDELKNPDLLEEYNDVVTVGAADNQISPQAWYDKLPCVGNGCCTIKEPLTPGNIPTIPVTYNWCGAKCGSGPYVNSVDLCCRAHDKCYGRTKKYPGRCTCDRNLISCLSGKGSRAASLISSAFKLKMKSKKC
ncbi:hypothetical protein [Oceanobacillus sp. CFH 90083]|uniref:hypothetical protein n=1 Tax=Oceanobacillus sp. CFH 90083 TaxID=2592336 RepID=UPI00128BB97C|nr:hypothetical protein [Oceanobacillus sp. CFH 90083]